MSKSRVKPPASKLTNTTRDHIAAALRGGVGMVPIAGGFLSELVNYVIPDQRGDRVASYLDSLSIRLDELEVQLKESIKSDAESVALIEDGAYASARATTGERVQRIVNCVANGLADGERDTLYKRRLLELFIEINDHECLLLYQHYDRAILRTVADQTLREAQESKPTSFKRPTDEMSANHVAAINKLERLGLIRFLPSVEAIGGTP